jgi:hypothetical protein
MHARRQIVVDGEPYEWFLRDDSLYGSERHIAVYSASAKGQTLKHPLIHSTPNA